MRLQRLITQGRLSSKSIKKVLWVRAVVQIDSGNAEVPVKICCLQKLSCVQFVSAIKPAVFILISLLTPAADQVCHATTPRPMNTKRM